MLPTFKAELYKLLSVRSTYFLTGLALVISAFWGFYIGGWLAKPAALQDSTFLVTQVTNVVGVVAMFGGFISILHLTHEYRYNTIMYTLTASNSRTKVLLAKILATTGFTLLFTLLIAVAAPVAAYVGVHAHGQTLAPQVIHLGDILWRTLFFGWGMAMIGFVVAAYIRNQVGSLVLFFLLNGPLEGILELLFKSKATYLPIDALGNLLGSKTVNTTLVSVSHEQVAITFGVEILVACGIAWILFLKRDAN